MKLKCESCGEIEDRNKYEFERIKKTKGESLVILKCPNCGHTSASHKRVPETKREKKMELENEIKSFLEEKGYETRLRIGKIEIPNFVEIQFNLIK